MTRTNKARRFPMRIFPLAAAAVLPLFLAAPAASQQPAQFVIQVWSYGFAPHPIHLAAGKPVTLTFVNRSGSGHDFTAPGFFQHAKITGGAMEGDEVELKPHETRSVTLVPARGTYQAHCSHFFHKQMGMSDEIIVD
jgi:plastocyanin